MENPDDELLHEVVSQMIDAMIDDGLSDVEICMEFFFRGHESGHACAEAHEALPEDPKVSAGYL